VFSRLPPEETALTIVVSWAIKETGDITPNKNISKPIVETIQYLKEIYSFSEKDHSDHD
jgi:hypothetical protein